MTCRSTDPNAIYNHIVIFQDRTVTTTVTLNGSASTTQVEGIIYVPAGQVKLNGNGGTLIVDQVIADTFDINGNGGTIKVLRKHGRRRHHQSRPASSIDPGTAATVPVRSVA